MVASNDGTSDSQNGSSTEVDSSTALLVNGGTTNSEKSIASDMATLGTVDSNNNNQEKVNDVVDASTAIAGEETLSFEKKKEVFQFKSISPNICRAESESRVPPQPHFQRCSSVPGSFSSSQNNQQMSPRQAHFSSSSFYDPREHPTIEAQVNLCREIAKQLVSDVSNAKSKGREMFERRVEKSSKWVTENEDSFQNFSSVEEDYHERTISEGPPNLRLLLDPRHVEDISTVQGVNEHIIATQEAQTRDTCRHIVQDLTSPEVNPNRGNVLFAKRVQKSITDGWIVDDVAEQVIDAARDKLFRNLKANHSASSSPIPSMSPYSRYSSPIAGPVFTPVASSLPPSRPASAMGLMFKDFNSRPKPFCRAF